MPQPAAVATVLTKRQTQNRARRLKRKQQYSEAQTAGINCPEQLKHHRRRVREHTRACQREYATYLRYKKSPLQDEPTKVSSTRHRDLAIHYAEKILRHEEYISRIRNRKFNDQSYPTFLSIDIIAKMHYLVYTAKTK